MVNSRRLCTALRCKDGGFIFPLPHILLHTFCFPLHKPTVSIIMQEIPDKGYVHVKRKTRH